MAETNKAFACPKCGRVIGYQTDPCPYCDMPIAWEGIEPPVQTVVQPSIPVSTVPEETVLTQTTPAQTVFAQRTPTQTTTPVADIGAVAAIAGMQSEVTQNVETPVLEVPLDSLKPQASDAGPVEAQATVEQPSLEPPTPELLVADIEPFAPEQPVAEAPAPELPVAEVQAPASEPPASEQPVAEVQAPVSEPPAPEQPVAEAQPPAPETPAPETSALELPVAEAQPPAPELPAPELSALETPLSEPPASDPTVLAVKKPKKSKKEVEMPASVEPASPESKDKTAPAPRKKGGAGARALAVILMTCAVIIWIIELVLLIGAGPSIMDGIADSSLEDIIVFLANNSSVISAVVGFFLGLLLFGMGELIVLLNDIRRNVR